MVQLTKSIVSLRPQGAIGLIVWEAEGLVIITKASRKWWDYF